VPTGAQRERFGQRVVLYEDCRVLLAPGSACLGLLQNVDEWVLAAGLPVPGSRILSGVWNSGVGATVLKATATRSGTVENKMDQKMAVLTVPPI
jgi:hypothetical protein